MRFNWAFWWTLTVAALPVLAFTAALITFVILKRVKGHDTDLSIFVDYSATRLVFIASWSSIVAPMLLGSLMTL
jgi:hypothetical protein